MIRILHVLPRLRRGGSQALVMNLYRHIDKTKYQFDFIIFTNDKDDYYDEILSLGGKVFHFHKFNGKNFFSIRKEWENFFRAHPEYRILHSHVRSFASIYIPVAKKNGVKTIIHSHSTSNGHGFKGFIKSILEFPLRFQADYLMACSKEAGIWLFGKKAISKENYLFLPNAIDLKKFAFNYEKRLEVRKKLHIPLDSVVIGHVGGIEKPKNHVFLLSVFKKIMEFNKNSFLLLVGDGTLQKHIENLAVELNVSDKVLFLGNQASVYDFYSAFDILVFPSLWEGLPVTLVEAQASGLKCLVSNKITKDVLISDCLEYKSLKESPLSWAKRTIEILDENKHKDRHVFMKFGNYDLFDVDYATNCLLNFYEKIIN